MRLNQFRIATRLTVAFALLAVLGALTNLFALHQLRASNERLRFTVLENNVKLEAANTLSQSVYIESRVMRSMLLLSDLDAVKREAPKIAKARAAYEIAWHTLSTFAPSAAAKPIRTAIEAARQRTLPVNDRVIALALQNRDEEAVPVLMQESLPLSQQWQAAIDDNLALLKTINTHQFEAAQAAFSDALWALIAATVATIVLSGLMAWAITRSIARPLGQIVGATQAIADGQLDTRLAVEGRDEVAAVTEALMQMCANLNRIVSGVRGNAESVASASAQIAQGNTDLSSRTEQQASALQETAASMEQFSASAKHNADHALQADGQVRQASDIARSGSQLMGDVVQTMGGIAASSHKIADILSVIDSIAFQTNILALNAAVEAARAGEQGRGFAVVASEVRTLAQRSASAAREIKTLISDSVAQTDAGSALVKRAGDTMQQLSAAIANVTTLISEISAASSEQSAGVRQVGEAVSQMDKTTQQNAALVEQSAAAAHSLEQLAAQLVEAVGVFHTSSSERV